MKDQLRVELHDAFGTVVAAGMIDVDSDAITPAELVEYEDGRMIGRVVTGPRLRLRDTPLMPAVLASNYVQDRPLNPHLPLYVTIAPA